MLKRFFVLRYSFVLLKMKWHVSSSVLKVRAARHVSLLYSFVSSSSHAFERHFFQVFPGFIQLMAFVIKASEYFMASFYYLFIINTTRITSDFRSQHSTSIWTLSLLPSVSKNYKYLKAFLFILSDLPRNCYRLHCLLL
jgi:hypothetical protein